MFVSRSFAIQPWHQVALGLAALVALFLLAMSLRPAVASSTSPVQAPPVFASPDLVALAGLAGDLQVDGDDLDFALIVIPPIAVLLFMAYGRVSAARPFLSSFVPPLDTPPPKRFA